MATNSPILQEGRALIPFPVRRAGRRLTVSTDGTADYASIQDAINDARDGDTIALDSGMYIGSVVVNKAIHLVGPSDPRFADDDCEFCDDLPYALIVGTGESSITWTANGGSIRDIGITLGPGGDLDTTALVRMPSGKLEMKRCVLSDGARHAVVSEGGDLNMVGCHIRNVEIGLSLTHVNARLERVHVEGPEVLAVTTEHTVFIALIDNCFEGRTVLRGKVGEFRGNDFDALFVHDVLSMTTNRASSLVHLCDFRSTDGFAVGI